MGHRTRIQAGVEERLILVLEALDSLVQAILEIPVWAQMLWAAGPVQDWAFYRVCR